MIDIDGIDLLGYEKGLSGWHIDPEAGFKIGAGADEVQWVERKIGAVPLADPKKSNVELEIPLIYIAEDDDEILSAVGELAEKSTAIAASAPTGGTEITWQKIGATYPSTLDCLWLDVGELEIKAEDQKMKVGRLTVKITCAPYIFGPEYLAASGVKPAGIPAADITVEDAKGDRPGPARLEITNRATIAQQFVIAGLQWQDAVGGNEMLLPASTFDVSSSPLNGTYTTGTNEVQRLTKTGTISGGTWPLSWGQHVFSTGFAHNAAIATVQAAIDAVIGAGNITVGGTSLDSGNMTFTFTGEFAARDVAAMTFSTASLTGGGSVALSTTTAGVEGYVATAAYSDYSAFARTEDQTDTGSFQIWARVRDYGSVANAVRVRATVAVGDPAAGLTNQSVAIPVTGAPVWVNLGPAHITQRSSGTHQWSITIEAATIGTAGTALRVYDLLKVPTELGRVMVATPENATKTLVLSDGYTQSAGNYTGKSMDLGGTVSGGGDGGDFTIDTTNDRLQRTTLSDASGIGRYVYGGSAMTDQRVSCSVLVPAFSGSSANSYGVLARFVDSNNYAFAAFTIGNANTFAVAVYERIAGTTTQIAKIDQYAFGGSMLAVDAMAAGGAIVLDARSDGRYTATLTIAGVTPITIRGHSSNLQTGGVLASGYAGLYDEHPNGDASTRYYDDFRAFRLPPADSAVFASRAAHWQYNGSMEREASGGTNFAYASGQQGAGSPLLGPGTNRLALATADQNPDLAATTNQAAELSWSLYHRPAYEIGRHEA